MSAGLNPDWDRRFAVRWVKPQGKNGPDQIGKYVHRCLDPRAVDKFCYGEKLGCAGLTHEEIDIYFSKEIERGEAKMVPLPEGHYEDTVEKRARRIMRDSYHFASFEEFLNAPPGTFRSTEDMAVRIVHFVQRDNDKPIIDTATGELLHAPAEERFQLEGTDGCLK